MNAMKKQARLGGGLWVRQLMRAVMGMIILIGAGLGQAWAASPPVTVTLTAPPNGSVYNAPVSITLTATASAGKGYTLSKVEFFHSGTVLIGTDTTSPYSYNWTNVPAGSYTITAVATAVKKNQPNQTATSAPVSITVNAVPSVSLTSPAEGSVFAAPGNVTLTAAASDPDGTIAKVEFFQGGTNLIATLTSAPYTYNWTGVAAGGYSLTAKATDNQNAATTSAPVNVMVTNAPAVTLTSPANNASFNAPANITLTATASDSDGGIQKVEFFHGGTNLIATVTSAPYTYDWTNVGAGNYSLTAKATDNLGIATASQPVNVTVSVPAPVGLYFIHTDHLNTPRLITNQQGQAAWRWANDDPFGNNVPNENPSGLGNFTFNLRFAGQYFDHELNTHQNYFRDYDPSIGRYIQSDPIGIAGLLRKQGVLYDEARDVDRLLGQRDADTSRLRKYTYDYGFMLQPNWTAAKLGLNLYGYVDGNPLSYVDPTGETTFTGVLIGAAVAGALIAGSAYLTNDCIQKCVRFCPIPEGGDEKQESDRLRHITACKANCANPFLILLQKVSGTAAVPSRTGIPPLIQKSIP